MLKIEKTSVCFESGTSVTSCREPEINVYRQLTTHDGHHLEVSWIFTCRTMTKQLPLVTKR